MGVWPPERAISLDMCQWLHLKGHAKLQTPWVPSHMFLSWTTKAHTNPGLSYIFHYASSQAVPLHRPPQLPILLITHKIFPCPTSSTWPWPVYFFFSLDLSRDAFGCSLSTAYNKNLIPNYGVAILVVSLCVSTFIWCQNIEEGHGPLFQRS